MTNTVVLSFLLLISSSSLSTGEQKRAPDKILSTLFSSIDSLESVISQNLEITKADTALQLKAILDNQPFVFGVSLIDKNGSVIADFNRSNQSVSIKDINSSQWFTVPQTSGIPFFGGVVKAHSTLCFLKSYPVTFLNDKRKTAGVLIFLLDATRCLKNTEQNSDYPFSVSYKSVKLYSSSSAEFDLPQQITLPGYEGLQISYSTSLLPETVDGNHENKQSFLTKNTESIMIFINIIVILFTGIFSFIGGRYYRNRKDYRKFLEMEYERISKEQQKQIHERALSQVYCDIKRQIETHELKKIEDDIRHKIESELHDKIIAG